MQPDTSYARLDGDRIGYQVFGHGPPEVVTTIGSYSHMDLVWEDPAIALYFRSLGSFSRVIRFDRRGTGVSDRLHLELLPPWESWAEELAVVLDAVGSQQAAIIAQVDSGPMALMFASTRPERTSALVLVNTTASGRSPTTTRSVCLARSWMRACDGSTSCGAPRPWRAWCRAARAMSSFAAGGRGFSGPLGLRGPWRRSSEPWPRSTPAPCFP